MSASLVFKIVESGSRDFEKAVLLQQEVLENFLPKKTDDEKNYIQIVGFLDQKICCAATLSKEEDGKFFMENVAVKQDLQSKGIGSQLLKFCEKVVFEKEGNIIYCCVEDRVGRSAVNFYLKNEYFCSGGDFLEDGTAYKIMWKNEFEDGFCA